MATFGKTTPGAGGAAISVNYKQVSKYPLSVTATVTSMSLYLNGLGAPSASQVLRGIIYSDSAGSPDAFKAVTEEITVADEVPSAWFTANLVSPVELGPGDYWLGFIAGVTDAAAIFNYDTVTNARKYRAETYSSSPSDPFGAPEATDAFEITVYATYPDPEASPLPILIPSPVRW